MVLRRADPDRFVLHRRRWKSRRLGAKVFQHEFTNYVMQKQMALDRATGDWVLLMDADEQATHDLGEEILRGGNIAAMPPTATASGASSTISATTIRSGFTPTIRCACSGASAGTSAGATRMTRWSSTEASATGQADPAFQLPRYRGSRRDDKPLLHPRRDGAGADRFSRRSDAD